jgi:hypothetical protein
MARRVSKIRKERRLNLGKKARALTARSARNGDRRRAAAQDGLGKNLKPGTMAKMGLG